MKFMHLSDLHIGKRVNEFSMLEDQRRIFDQILTLADRERVDGVWIAGDIYDKTVPSAEAVQLFDDFLTGLAQRGLLCFIISGNHDSAERIAFGGRLMNRSGVYLAPVFNGKVECVELEDDYGPLRIYLLPFLKPACVRQVYPDAKVESYQDAVQLVVDGICGRGRQDAEALAEDEAQGAEDKEQGEEGREQRAEDEAQGAEGGEQRAEDEAQCTEDGEQHTEEKRWDPDCRNVILAHQFLVGAARCESEEISVGGLDQVSAEIFRDFDYTALGHLHTPQNVGGENIRYCGTPLKYSFSESEDEKSVTVVELKEKGNVSWYTVPLKPWRDLRKIRGTYMELTALENYRDTDVEDYLHVTLTDEEDVPDALGKLRSIYPNIMRLDYDNLRTRNSQAVSAAEAVEKKHPLELFEELYRLQNNQDMNEEQRKFAQEMIEKIWEQQT